MMTNSSEVDLSKYFPIPSQTSDEDKVFLLLAIQLLKDQLKSFRYLEIGSFLGGSLAPFLMEDACSSILSIDDRNRNMPDERGALYDYTGVSNDTMIENIHSHKLSTDKLSVFDGSSNEIPLQENKFDFAFIDGEHTDEATFRDFVHVLPLLNNDSIVTFHDSTMIYKAIKMVAILLTQQKVPFQLFKRANSEMTCLGLGSFSGINLSAHLGQPDDLQDFYTRSEASNLSQQINNRVSFTVNYTIKPPPTFKMI